MAGKLKTFTTTSGFFDLAVAAPSMKAALDLWGAAFNLFTHGFARRTDEASIVAATLARPGVVLRRPVGTDRAYSEHAEASLALPYRKAKAAPSRQRTEPANKPAKAASKPAKPADKKAERAAALTFAREQKRRDRRSRQEEAALHKEAERRDRAIAAAQAALEKAQAAHTRTSREIGRAQAQLDSNAAGEDARWKKEKDRLDDALRHARVPRPLKAI